MTYIAPCQRQRNLPSIGFVDMKAVYAEVGRRIRLHRQAKDLTQAKVAEAAGIETSFYGQVERGVNVPSLKTVYALAQALGVEVAMLLPSGKAAEAHPAYAKAIERLLQGLPAEKRRLALDLIGDLARRLRKQ